MILQYQPANKVAIDKVALEFNEKRDSIRVKLGQIYEEYNEVVQLGTPHMDPIYQRRDIYKNINATDNYFFLNYDKNDLLSEVEIHRCEKINVFDVSFDFDEELDSIVLRLSKYSSVVRKSEGEYFLRELKVVISSRAHMGGEGDTLGYFYCSSDVAHLEDDNLLGDTE